MPWIDLYRGILFIFSRVEIFHFSDMSTSQMIGWIFSLPKYRSGVVKTSKMKLLSENRVMWYIFTVTQNLTVSFIPYRQYSTDRGIVYIFSFRICYQYSHMCSTHTPRLILSNISPKLATSSGSSPWPGGVCLHPEKRGICISGTPCLKIWKFLFR